MPNLPKREAPAARECLPRRLGMSGGPIKATGADTDGAYALVEFTAPPGDPGPPPHLHNRTGEAFYVIDGTLTIRRGREEVTATAGSFVFIRPGVVHTFAVVGPGPARFLVLLSPPEFVSFFQEMLGEPAAAPPPGGHDIEEADWP